MKKLLLIILILLLQSMYVSAQVPVAAFYSSSVSCGGSCCTVYFHDLSTNLTNRTWYFEGSHDPPSYSQYPVVVHDGYGNWNVMLVVCNSYGCDTATCVFVTDSLGCHDCNTAAGINVNPVENSALTVYPNPSNGNNINVSFPYISTGVYQVLNIFGEEVALGNIMNTDKIEINLGGIAQGCYFVKVQARDRSYVGRFVKGD